jgi:hypothetical protein
MTSLDEGMSIKLHEQHVTDLPTNIVGQNVSRIYDKVLEVEIFTLQLRVTIAILNC